MGTKNKFMIFAHARSGSTTLAKVLECHKDIKIYHEPFNIYNKFKPKDVIEESKKVHDFKSLDRLMEKYLGDYNGLKTLFDNLEDTINEFLISKRDYKIIFLIRKNILRSLISTEISMKTDIWSPSPQDMPAQKIRTIIKGNIFEPISEDKFRKDLLRRKRLISHYRNVLMNKKEDYYELAYEDIFDENVTIDKRLAKIKDILKFLGFNTALEREVISRMKSFLEPKSAKINNNDTYLKIPNIREIDREFRSRENGYILDNHL